jgi:hypothetical protein
VTNHIRKEHQAHPECVLVDSQGGLRLSFSKIGCAANNSGSVYIYDFQSSDLNAVEMGKAHGAGELGKRTPC